METGREEPVMKNEVKPVIEVGIAVPFISELLIKYGWNTVR